MGVRYQKYRSIAIPLNIGIELSQVSRYFDIFGIEPALLVCVSHCVDSVCATVCVVFSVCATVWAVCVCHCVFTVQCVCHYVGSVQCVPLCGVVFSVCHCVGSVQCVPL